MPTRSPIPRLAVLWPLWALLLLTCHGVLLAFLHARPGRVAILPFVVGPMLLLGLTAVTVALALYEILHGGWRRVLRGRLVFDALALSASLFLSLFAYRSYPSSYDMRPAGPCLAMPFGSDIAVLQGGMSIDTNYHAGSPSQRFAYDLAVYDLGSTHIGEGSVVWDYFTYGQPVLAPMSGVVVAAVDGNPDQSPSTVEWQPWRSAAGNNVTIEIGPDQYLFLNHLQSGSISVKTGDTVAVGVPIGRVGNSGRSGAPHLHLHVQDTAVPGGGEGIPVEFCAHDAIDWGAAWETARRIERGVPTGRARRQIIRAATVPASDAR